MIVLNNEQKWALQCFEELKANRKISYENAGKLVGVGYPIICAVKKGNYKGNTETALKPMVDYFKTAEEKYKTTVFKEVEYAPTSISEFTYKNIRRGQIKGGFSVIVGAAGVGKTKACKKFVSDFTTETVYITATVTMKSVKSLLKTIAKSIGVSRSSDVNELWNTIVDKLHDGMVIIIDEAQHLTYNGIEAVRGLSDYFDDRSETLGIVLVGNPGIIETINGKRGRAMEQVDNRTWHCPDIKTTDCTIDDIKMLFPVLVDQGMSAELMFLYEVAQTTKGIRGAVRLFISACENGTYNLQGLMLVAKTMNFDSQKVEQIIRKSKREAV